jgi:outer membrane protein TolC
MRRPLSSIPARALTLFILLGALFSDATAQEPIEQTTVEGTGSTFPIDLVTALRLAGARNLDVQLAQTAVQDAHANYYSAIERFLPTFVPAASYLHHSGRDQNVNGTLIDVTKHNETAGVTAVAEIPVGEALFQTLQTRQLLAAADAAQTAQEQETQLAVAQQYLELVNAGALVEVVTQALAISQNYEQQLNEAVRIGTAFKGDALRVQTQTRRLQLDLTRAKEQRRLAATRLAQTLHLDPLVDLIPAEREPAPLALSDLNGMPDALVRTALQNRPELAQTGSLIAAAQQARRGALYGPLIPTIGGRAFA